MAATVRRTQQSQSFEQVPPAKCFLACSRCFPHVYRQPDREPTLQQLEKRTHIGFRNFQCRI